MRVVVIVNTHDLKQLEEHSKLRGSDREMAILTYPGDPHEDPAADDPRQFPDARFSVRLGLVAPRAYHPGDDDPAIDPPFSYFPEPFGALSHQQYRTL